MNIFSVLQRGNSSVREVTLTAWLSYLLDSNEDHGLSDRFFRYFIGELNSQINSEFLTDYLHEKNKKYNYVVGVEQDISEKQDNSSKVDIRIAITEIDGQGKEALKDETLILYIENKVSPDSAGNNQLLSYLECLENENAKHKALCYLTPDEKIAGGKLTKEFNVITDPAAKSSISTCWLKWKNFEEQQGGTVLKMLRDLLAEESCGQISPITDYIRHTIKAMCFFIDDNDNFNEKPRSIRKSPANLDDYRRRIEKYDLDNKVMALIEALRSEIENSLLLGNIPYEFLLDLNTYQDARFIQFDFFAKAISAHFKIRFSVSIDSKNHHTNIAINSLTNAKGDKDKLEVVNDNVKTLELKRSGSWYLRTASNSGKPLAFHSELITTFMEYLEELRALDHYIEC